jgi:hypothetical protein
MIPTLSLGSWFNTPLPGWLVVVSALSLLATIIVFYVCVDLHRVIMAALVDFAVLVIALSWLLSAKTLVQTLVGIALNLVLLWGWMKVRPHIQKWALRQRVRIER